MAQDPTFIADSLAHLAAQNRMRHTQESPMGRVDFSSNDYLGLGRSGELNIPSSPTLPHGSTGSRLLRGHHPIHGRMERFCSRYFRSEACLYFNSGYMANLGLLSAIGHRHATFIYDEQVHASIKDGMRLSQAKRLSFPHQDLAALEKRLSQLSGDCFLVVESLYSMSGTRSDLQAMADLCQRHGAWLIVDEAHSTGIWGPEGSGAVREAGLEAQVFARVHTFGKAPGRQGAVVAGSAQLCQFLVNKARTYVYTTAGGPQQVQETLKALIQLKEMDGPRALLRVRVNRFKELLASISLKTEADGPIFPIHVPGDRFVLAASKQLENEGFDVRAIRSPTVPEGKECLRVIIHSFNTMEEISSLALAIAKMDN